MRTLFSALFVLSFVASLAAQDVINITLENTICRFDVRKQMPQFQDAVVSSIEDDTGLIPTIERIQEVAGMSSRDFIVLVAENINNAYATHTGGQDLIICDVDFLEEINTGSNTDWGAISIIAHEVGHHRYHHTTQAGDKHAQELEADRFSGYVLARLGSSKKSAIAAIKFAGTDEDTKTHPSKYRRIQAISSGWEKGNRE